MPANKLTRRIAATVLAAALSLGGLLGVAAIHDVDHVDPPQEQAGATWSFTVPVDGKGGASTQGATWS